MSERAYLVWGAVLGLSIALAALLLPSPMQSLTQDAIASVNGALISRSHYEKVLANVASEKTIDEAMRRRVLDVLIEEELLLQNGIAQGLPSQEQSLRANIINAVLGQFSADANVQAQNADDELLEAYYREHESEFAGAPLYRIQVKYHVSHSDEALALPFALPETAMSLGNIASYLGTSAANLVGELTVGETSAALAFDQGQIEITLLEKVQAPIAAFADVKDKVRQRYADEQAGKLLKEFIDEQRSQSTIIEAE